MKNKVKTLEEIVNISERAKQRGKKVVTTNGCFDLLHLGHVKNLQFAKKQGDILIVGLNSDASVKKSKGDSRPIVSQDDRVQVIVALECVDYTFIFEDSPFDWISKIKPDIQVKSEDVKDHPAFTPEKNEVEKYGGRVVLAPYIEGKSTSNIIKKIRGG